MPVDTLEVEEEEVPATSDAAGTMLLYMLSLEAVCPHCARIVPITAPERHNYAPLMYSMYITCKRCQFTALLSDFFMVGADMFSRRPDDVVRHGRQKVRFKHTKKRLNTKWAEDRYFRRYWQLHKMREAQGMLAFLEHLSNRQKRSFLDHGHLDIKGSEGGKYRLYFARHSNIAQVDANGMPLRGWCYHAGDFMSVGDNLLTQMFAIETNERAFFQQANVQREDWMDGLGSYSNWKSALKDYQKIIKKHRLDQRETQPLLGTSLIVLDMDLDDSTNYTTRKKVGLPAKRTATRRTAAKTAKVARATTKVARTKTAAKTPA
ncbi:MAG: hypothetical protein JSS66_07465 [Armatimonadetes bacterium]|nr:hypothetical protein [Armatimonadota bacterium]